MKEDFGAKGLEFPLADPVQVTSAVRDVRRERLGTRFEVPHQHRSPNALKHRNEFATDDSRATAYEDTSARESLDPRL